MKIASVSVLLLVTTLGGCQAWDMDGDHVYAGAPGSSYDMAANPPRALGGVTYNPYAPIAQNLPNSVPVTPNVNAAPANGPVR